MIISIEQNNIIRRFNLEKGYDISIPLHRHGPRAWYVPEARIAPVLNQHFTGSTRLGGKVNFNDVAFNPHGHGTHTETVGHIASESFPITSELSSFHHIAALFTITPRVIQGDHVIQMDQVQEKWTTPGMEAVIIRTLPNSLDKTHRNYSNTNFPYMDAAAAEWLASVGVRHLLIDLPSIDREEDGGALKAHHAFWSYPHQTRRGCTISEMVYIDDEIQDGEYLMMMAPAAFINDAAPSRIVLYAPID